MLTGGLLGSGMEEEAGGSPFLPSFSVARTLTSLSHWKEKKGGGAPRSADQSPFTPFSSRERRPPPPGDLIKIFHTGKRGGSWGSTVVVRQREEDWRTGGKGGGGSFGTGLRMEGEEK